MKYGLIYYRDTHNIGDDILSYAGKQFLPQVDYHIDRESLDTFIPDTREYVATIVNGWYLHHNYTFQPSPYLFPLFIGTHFSKDQMLFNDYSWIDNALSTYLRQHGPIGCRDRHTEQILAEKDIPSFFSGCLTLTLPKFPDILPNHKTILVDIPNEIADHIKSLLPDSDLVYKTHRLTHEEACLDWAQREKRLTDYLKLYQGADLVITTRLHCALPCIALGTPVIFCSSFDEDYSIRIASFADYLPCYSTAEILSHKADDAILNPQKNKTPDTLISRLRIHCENFIENTVHKVPDIDLLPEPSFYRSIYVDRTQYMRHAINTLFDIRYALENQVSLDSQNMEKAIALCNQVLDENEHLKQQIRKLTANIDNL